MADPVEKHPAATEGGGPDLLTLGLVAYFVGLILVVGGLLALPALT